MNIAEPSLPTRRVGPGVLVATWSWGWLAITQFVTSMLLAGPYLVLGAILLSGLASIPAFGFGIPIAIVALTLALVAGRFERARTEAFTGVRVPPPSRARPGTPVWRRLLLNARPWRALAHATLTALWGLLVGPLTLVLTSASAALATLPVYAGLLPKHRLSLTGHTTLAPSGWLVLLGWAGILVLPLVARGLVVVDVNLARWLLGPSRDEQVAALSERVETLTLTREAAVDSVELERRRIERDLHDGPQQKLVAIAMDLGMAQAKLGQDPDAARELVDKAHAMAKEAIVDMRQVARGIHPPVLTDRGLDAALSALAARSPVPVTVRVEVRPRPSATIEAIAYFCVSEALTNVAKHSGARSAQVEVLRRNGALTLTVRDDGRGGADPVRGTGLNGLRDRVAAVDGTIAVSSPPGGPTVLTVTLPAQANLSPPGPDGAQTRPNPYLPRPGATPAGPMPTAPTPTAPTPDGPMPTGPMPTETMSSGVAPADPTSSEPRSTP